MEEFSVSSGADKFRKPTFQWLGQRLELTPWALTASQEDDPL
jgi:hypothetical protein